MANTGFKGINAVQTGSQIVFRASLKTSALAALTTGTTTLAIYELQSDGTLKSYDFSSNTFKTTTLTTATENMSQQAGNNGSTNTGIWTYALATLTGFTVGAVYIAVIINSSASPAQQEREFVYGSAEGDLVVTSTGTGTANLNADAKAINAVSTSSVTTVGAFIGNATAAIAVNGSGSVTYANAAPPAASAIATAIWEDTTAGGDFGTAGSIGKLIATTGLTIAGISGVTLPTVVASPTNITAGTITTVTNLTNAPTNGDLTAAMKTSVELAAASALSDIAAIIGTAPADASYGTLFAAIAENSGYLGYPAALTVTGPATLNGTDVTGTYYAQQSAQSSQGAPYYQGPNSVIWPNGSGGWVLGISINSGDNYFANESGPPWVGSWSRIGTYTGSPTVTVPAVGNTTVVVAPINSQIPVGAPNGQAICAPANGQVASVVLSPADRYGNAYTAAGPVKLVVWSSSTAPDTKLVEVVCSLSNSNKTITIPMSFSNQIVASGLNYSLWDSGRSPPFEIMQGPFSFFDSGPTP